MTTAAALRDRHATRVAALAGAGTYPVAVALGPPPAAWPALLAALAALAARAGWNAGVAGRRVWPRPTVAAGLVAGGATADLALRTLLRVTSGDGLDTSLAAGATLLAAGLVAGGWLAGRWLALRTDEAVERGSPPGDVRPVGHGLLTGGAVTVAAAGWALWGQPAGGWQPTAVGLAVVAYAGLALVHHQALRRAALVAGWERTGRVVHPGIARHWRTWVVLALGGGLAVVALWWTPPAEPLRRSAEQASPQTVSQIQDFVDRHRMSREDLVRPGGVAGESMPFGEATPLDEDRERFGVQELFDWLLAPLGEVADIEPPPGEDRPLVWHLPHRLLLAALLLAGLVLACYLWLRRRAGEAGVWATLRETLAAWWARLRAALGGMFRRRARPDPGPQPTRRPADRAQPARRVPWRRPATPREQVKYDYLRMVARAERRGLARHRAQSPSQYARVLQPALPGHRDDVDELTSAFVRARYSHHPIDAGTAEQTRQASRTLRRALKGQT